MSCHLRIANNNFLQIDIFSLWVATFLGKIRQTRYDNTGDTDDYNEEHSVHLFSFRILIMVQHAQNWV